MRKILLVYNWLNQSDTTGFTFANLKEVAHVCFRVLRHTEKKAKSDRHYYLDFYQSGRCHTGIVYWQYRIYQKHDQGILEQRYQQ